MLKKNKGKREKFNKSDEITRKRVSPIGKYRELYISLRPYAQTTSIDQPPLWSLD